MAHLKKRQTASPQPTELFFPTALSLGPGRLDQFNFELNFLETLRLPSRLEANHSTPRSKTQHVQYPSIAVARKDIQNWYGDYKCFLDTNTDDSAPSQDDNKATELSARLADQARRGLDKWAIFQQSGKQLTQQLATDNADFDGNNAKVRLDVFDNIMVFDAPAWSDCAVHLTHGFPRRLILADHGGYTLGNITCAAKVTNEFIRAFADHDVFSFTSKAQLSRTGMTESELMYYRALTIKLGSKYHREGSRLMEGMFR